MKARYVCYVPALLDIDVPEKYQFFYNKRQWDYTDEDYELRDEWARKVEEIIEQNYENENIAYEIEYEFYDYID